MSEPNTPQYCLEKNEASVESYLVDLQTFLVNGFQEFEDAGKSFVRDEWERPEGGGGITRVFSDGEVFEKVGVGFSRVEGAKLPKSASANRNGVGEEPFVAMGVSLVAHPRNPMVPTSHMNVRYFRTRSVETGEPLWWFGGGYDLTPYYGFDEDCIHWHKTAKEVCLQHYDDAFYEKLKNWCDDYFYIKHRQCARGIGGIFFDDLQTPDFDAAFDFTSAVGRSFADAYFPIVARRKNEPYTDVQRQFQLYRRGRYVEFNLVYDRGTLFGLQSGGRVESILMSMPPLVRFDYGWQNEVGSWEEALEKRYLVPQDWAGMSDDVSQK